MSISPGTIMMVGLAFIGTLVLARVLEQHSKSWTRKRAPRGLTCSLIDHRAQSAQCRDAWAQKQQTGDEVAVICSRCGERLDW